MITLSSPENGWIDMAIKAGDHKFESCFSDVGPNTVMDLQMAIKALTKGKDHFRVELFLEPSEAELIIRRGGEPGTLSIEYRLHG